MSSARAIESLFADGEGAFAYPLRYVTCGTGEGESDEGESDEGSGKAVGGVKVLVSVPKRNHKRAVVRNLLKRRIREAYRLNKAPLLAALAGTEANGAGGGLHLGLIYTAKKVEDYAHIEAAVRKAIAQVIEKMDATAARAESAPETGVEK